MGFSFKVMLIPTWCGHLVCSGWWYTTARTGLETSHEPTRDLQEQRSCHHWCIPSGSDRHRQHIYSSFWITQSFLKNIHVGTCGRFVSIWTVNWLNDPREAAVHCASTSRHSLLPAAFGTHISHSGVWGGSPPCWCRGKLCCTQTLPGISRHLGRNRWQLQSAPWRCSLSLNSEERKGPKGKKEG